MPDGSFETKRTWAAIVYAINNCSSRSRSPGLLKTIHAHRTVNDKNWWLKDQGKSCHYSSVPNNLRTFTFFEKFFDQSPIFNFSRGKPGKDLYFCWVTQGMNEIYASDVNWGYLLFVLVVAQPAQTSDPPLINSETFSNPLLIMAPAYFGA